MSGRRTVTAPRIALTAFSRLEGTMRANFLFPSLLVASAALGWFAPLAVGKAPTDGTGVAATERQFGANVPICRGPASAGAPRGMLHLAQARTEVPKAEMQAASPAGTFADTDPPLWEGLGGVTYKITTANETAQSYFDQGLRLTYAFNHSEAQRAFRKAQKHMAQSGSSFCALRNARCASL